MRASELAMQLSAMHNEIELEIESVYKNLAELFLPDIKEQSTSNVDVVIQSNLHNAMAHYAIISGLNTKYTKMLAACKELLDINVGALGNSSEGIPGQKVLLGKSNIFQFSKKQNQDGTTTLVKDLITELARASVEKSVVDKAVKEASKVKKGNVYYEVTLVED